MSENNEIDDIIKEVRNKNEELDRAGRFEDFDTKAPKADEESEKSEEVTFTVEPEEESPTEETVEEVVMEAPEEATDEEPEELVLDIPESEENTDEESVIGIIDDEQEYPEQEELDDNYEEYAESDNGKKKKIIIIVVAVVAVLAIVAAIVAFALKGDSKDETSTTTTTTKPVTTELVTEAPEVIVNPLTGEAGFSKSAVDVRPVACVVENSYYARPQWGIDDEKKSPDIILEGEVEGGESRMLWFFADYSKLPDQIGPMRSARPPYIRFSQLFDAIFIHWGQSQSKGEYVGANTVFAQNNIDHINQMTTSGVSYLFSRDSSRSGYGIEHTGILYGEKLPQAIKDCGFRTKADSSRYTKFSFNETAVKLGDTACNTLGLTFSSRSKTRDWTYDAKDKMYHSQDYSNSSIGFSDVSRKNLLVLFDNTQYINKYNYKGHTEVYCNYSLDGGKGKLASMGTVIDIVWSVENGVIVLKDTAGNEVKLNPGKTWIGWGSANKGGSVKIG